MPETRGTGGGPVDVRGSGKPAQAEARACAKVLRQEMPHFIDEKTKGIGNLSNLVPQGIFLSPPFL